MDSRPKPWTTLLLLVLLLAWAVSFAALGRWQLQRRVWKLDLIARVNARAHAPPVPAPGPAAWPGVNVQDASYRRVRVRGVYLNDKETEVQALTELGAGYWVLTPLAADGGFTVMVNRGFVPPDRVDAATRRGGQIEGPTTVTGLLRISETRGGFLHSNDPAHGLWYSRDVSGIAASRGLPRVAPYFIDADAVDRPGAPVGGLTVIVFPNSHLIYAATWFTLALMCAGAAGWLLWTQRPALKGGGR